jgi:hypothetical protein
MQTLVDSLKKLSEDVGPTITSPIESLGSSSE